ncbi:MAG: GNAT family N-acetyltransferase [Chloroflexi bacterium]|nr:GNAT family N-acetyltransferase [Chloroflexota bacterium]
MFTVRSATPAEAPLIVGFQLHMAEESEGAQLDRGTLTAGVAAVFDGRAQASYWMAEDDQQVVGMLMTVPEWSDWRNGTVVWMHSVYVVPEARRRGVFRSMYDHLLAMVRKSDDLVGLRLYVDRTNERAQHVYEAMGMTREHYHMYEWLK